jgi:hypothetical protein
VKPKPCEKKTLIVRETGAVSGGCGLVHKVQILSYYSTLDLGEIKKKKKVRGRVVTPRGMCFPNQATQLPQ